MSDTTKVRTKKLASADVTPVRSRVLHLHRATFQPTTEASTTAQRSAAEDIEPSSSGHNFVQVRVQPAATSCPLGLNAPRACPFGGICHACPVRVQAKLTMSQPGNRYEEEADRVADMIMSMPEPCPQCQEKSGEEVQTKLVRDQITPLVRRQVEPEEEEEEAVQTKSTFHQPTTVSPALATSIQSLRGGGQPLSAPVRSFFERRFGREFGTVRIHTDARVAATARALHARAFTVGQEIAFGAGQYAPHQVDGRRLLAHELAHVVQNNISQINLWGWNDHKEITRTAAKGLISDTWFLFHLLSRVFDPDISPSKVAFGLGIIRGEGPEHGEDGNYSEPNEFVAARQNESYQTKMLHEALHHRRTAASLATLKKPVHEIGAVRGMMFDSLAKACHCAQDRGAHGEGAKGHGHDDPRVRIARWNPDSPRDNAWGYSRAIGLTRAIFEQWNTQDGES